MGLEKRKNLLRRWRNDPVCWAHDNLFDRPYPRQDEALAMYAENKWFALCCCRDWGKSRFAAIVALHWLATRYDSLVFTSAPRWSQVEQATWANIRSVWRNSKLPNFHKTWRVMSKQIQTPSPLWRAVGVAAAREEDTEGRHAGKGGALVMFDEAKGVRDPFFNSAVNMLGRKDVENKLVAIGTPGIPRGWFYGAFGPDRARWATMRGSALDVPELREHAEAERERLGENNPFWRQQQLGEFSMAEGNVVIPLSTIERAIRPDAALRRMAQERRPEWLTIISLDPSGGGGDEAIMGHRVGPVLVHAEAVNPRVPEGKLFEECLAEYTFNFAKNAGADAIAVDEPGVGLIVCRVLDQLADEWRRKTHGEVIKILRYKPGIKARNSDRYQNRKSEDIFLLSEKFRDGEIYIPDIPDLIGQLCSWTHSDTRTSKTEVLDPSDSPDWADMTNIAFAADRLSHHVRGINPADI